MSPPATCPIDGTELIGLEYAYGEKWHYDGVSEYVCPKDGCHYRECRWCLKKLEEGQSVIPFCTGEMHPGPEDSIIPVGEQP